MKTRISLKSNLAYSIFFAGTFIFATACNENTTVDSKEVAEQENIERMETNENTITVVENDNDAEFLVDAAEIQLELISLGKLAQQNANSDHVRELGKMMENDHIKALSELKTLAQSKAISIPTSITEDSKENYDKLKNKTGSDFGKAYSEMMVEQHEDAIALFEKASTESTDSAVGAWASKMLPGLKTHLTRAEACKVECDKMKS